MPEQQGPQGPQVPSVTGSANVPITEATLRHHAQELGLLGKFFGSREHAPLNIAGIIAFFGLIGLMASLFATAPAQNDLAKTFGGIVIAALTFLGGYWGGGGGKAEH
jgi:hypothetical protein